MKCNVRDISINYKIIGEGKPIVMIHGYAADHRLMSACMETVFNINSNYKRIYIDLPGMGNSKGAEWLNCADIMLDVIIEFINKILPNENFLLVGQSYGGYISRGIVYKMAHRVDGLLLICPCIIADRKKRNIPEKIILVKNEELLSKVEESDVERFNSALVIQDENTFERYRDEVLSGIKKEDISFLRNYRKNGYSFSFDVDKLEKKFNKPMLMTLEKQDSGVGYKDAWDILGNFPRATFAVLDRAGHNLQIEQNEVFNCLVNEWLRRVEDDIKRKVD
ncbi:alpha/beta fold hydrolase [Clostridium magnum]|uniref:2-hydroxy-6-oxo-6-phenylhexa-2,4-dienoate hydrolase n=1 Tax=Clostridium magnum DSM 2767 TaxID=1121326 RepID=A0A161WGY8_9CLOT|nr:alpha/beta hydrolase [Clostridium magnum]KZL90935.1 2-hydroxy-6-oxo-6-phenylhexa-2,4-dienoate hydrolase [Clostridium magnum DSM 2767]SHJ01337.1 Pimeloyl-ACP methyl ester carboxylesterase [Clostridium magnum DSM 2767]